MGERFIQEISSIFFSAPNAFAAHIAERAVNPYQLVLDVILLGIILYIISRKPEKPERPLSEREIQAEIDDFEPDPLFPSEDNPLNKLDRVPIIKGSTVTEVVLEDDRKVLHMARTNFLGMINNPRVEDAALKALRKYGTGTCGPRGFYGTIDIHMELEKRITKFLDAEDCLIYSFGFSTIASAVPAFAGREDLLIVDKGVNYAIQTGVKLSRSDVMWFNHNDMKDLERILVEVSNKDKKKSRPVSRRYIVFEGLYYNTGDVANLPEIFKLKNKYFYRTIMDDSYGIGVLGKTGRGTCEHFGIPPREIDILTGNLEGITSSVGGFCCANKHIVYHQRLNSTGYVYSASLPPLLTAASIAAFDIMDENPALIKKLSENIEFMYRGLQSVKGLTLTSTVLSPILHLQLTDPTGDQYSDEELLQNIVDKALEDGVLLTRAKYVYGKESFLPKPSLRVMVSAALSKEQMQKAITAITTAAQSVFANRSTPNASNRKESGVQKRK